MEHAETRTELLIGTDGIRRLKESCVCVLGIGGVGSYCAEALARSGVGRLILVDGDTVAESNLNRQIMAVRETVGQAKTQAMKDRILQYRGDLEVEYCLLHKIPFISSMGMANRMDPTKLTVMDLMKTSYDPLAKVMRGLMRKSKIKGKIPVVCSLEQPMTQTRIINENGKTRKEKMPPASSSFVPAAAGLACASYAVTTLLKNGKSSI